MKKIKPAQFERTRVAKTYPVAFYAPEMVAAIYQHLIHHRVGTPVRLEIDFSSGPKSATMLMYVEPDPKVDYDYDSQPVITLIKGNAGLEFDPSDPSHDIPNRG